MNPVLKHILERAETWPEDMQKEAARSLLEIEERRSGIYVLSDAEWSDIQAGLEQAERGDFVPESELRAFERSRGG
jgi:predicted transcriptional regulator